MDPNYTPDPNNMSERIQWQYTQNFGYAVLRFVVIPTELRQYVEGQSGTSDAQLVLIQMTDHVKNSTYAMISTREMLTKIVTAKLNIKTWTKSTYDYIVTLNHSFHLYNSQQGNPAMKINEYQMRAYMQNALSAVRVFREASDREHDRIIEGKPAFTYEEYMICIKSAASRLDSERTSRSSRDVNMADHGESYDDESFKRESLDINEAKRQSRPPSSFSASMNKETWNSLEKGTQDIWDTLSKEEKTKILTYAKDRSEKRTSANVHSLEDIDQISANVHDTKDVEERGEKPPENGENTSIDVHNVLTGIRSEAHPGDPRRVMGSSKPKASTKDNLMAMVHRIYSPPQDSDNESVHSEEFPDFHLGGL